MDGSTTLLISAFLTVITAATPLVFAALGELVVEKSGVLNLGVEGMMIIGAVTAFWVAIATDSGLLGVLAGMFAGMVLAAIFAGITLGLLANQVATGLALTLFGLGLSALMGHQLVGQAFSGIKGISIPYLSDLPLIGTLLFGLDPLVYFSVIMTAVVTWFLTRTRGGLILRAIGENHEAAHAIGHSVLKVRFLAILFGGAMAGIGGAYLSLAYTPLWAEGMTAGRGWIALALVVFAAWRPWRAFFGAYLFGGVFILQLHAQGMGIALPSQILSMLPYLVTIAVLVWISANKNRQNANAPACLGKAFFASK